jgi:hypothetical protein
MIAKIRKNAMLEERALGRRRSKRAAVRLTRRVGASARAATGTREGPRARSVARGERVRKQSRARRAKRRKTRIEE